MSRSHPLDAISTIEDVSARIPSVVAHLVRSVTTRSTSFVAAGSGALFLHSQRHEAAGKLPTDVNNILHDLCVESERPVTKGSSI